MKVGFEIKKLILSWQLKLYDGIVRTGRKNLMVECQVIRSIPNNRSNDFSSGYSTHL